MIIGCDFFLIDNKNFILVSDWWNGKTLTEPLKNYKINNWIIKEKK